MATRNWTDEQKAAIGETSRTLLVSAAAGSGKTATLTERLIRMITDPTHPLDVSRMLIVTFTRAAAGELKERITDALGKALADDPGHAHLSKQMLLLPCAKIRTIDSFCNDLVKGHTDALGIQPGYRIPDPAEDVLLAGQTMETVLSDAYDGIFEKDGVDIVTLSECLVGAKDEGSLSDVLLRLYHTLMGYKDGVSLLSDMETAYRTAAETPAFFDTPWGAFVRSHVSQILTDLSDMLRQAAEQTANAATPGIKDALALSAAQDDLAALQSFLSHLSVGYSAAKQALEAFSPTKVTLGEKLSEQGLRLKDMRTFIKKNIEDMTDRFFVWSEEDIPASAAQTADIMHSLFVLLHRFDEAFAAEKRRRNLCDYEDIERFALSLLCEQDGSRTALAEHLSSCFDAVCIDEYQDVNEVQHRIFEAICTARNRFMVGDIKQSIYGFRGAQPSIFASLRAAFPDHAQAVLQDSDTATLFLTKNFRSTAGVIDFANGVFDPLFSVLGESIGYREEDRLNQGRAQEHPPKRPTVFWLYKERSAKGAASSERSEIDETDESSEEAEIRAALPEASLVAKEIAALLKDGKKENGEPVLPSDVAILLRNNKPIPAYSAALQEAGVPVCTEDTENFFLHPEILLALCLLNTVNNPLRDVYLAGALRSPVYRFTLDELIALRRENKQNTLFDCLKAHASACPEDSKTAFFLQELAAFRALSEGMPSDRFLRLLYDRTGLLNMTDAPGRKRLLSLYDGARRYEANAFHGLYPFLCYINEIAKEGAAFGEGRIQGQEDGVHILTAHRSKGLEFPICFLAGFGGKLLHNDAEPLPFHASLGVAVCLRDKTGLALIETPFVAALRACRKLSFLDEETRVLYVALTRAKEGMVVTANPQKTGGMTSDAERLHRFPSATAYRRATSYLEWMLGALGIPSEQAPSPLFTLQKINVDEMLASLSVQEEARPANATAEQPEASEADALFAQEAAELYALFEKRFATPYPYAAHTRLPSKVSVSRLYPTLLDEREDSTATPLFSFALSEKEAVDAPQTEDVAQPTEAVSERPFVPTLPVFLGAEKGNAAAAAGTATHLFLQFCSFDAIAAFLQTHGVGLNEKAGTGRQNATSGLRLRTAKEAVKQELDRLQQEQFITKEDASRVRLGELASFVCSPFFAGIVHAQKILREFRFHANLPADAFSLENPDAFRGTTLLVQGVIDLLLWEEDGSLTLADYKTDRLTREELTDPSLARATLFARHGEQLTYYKAAIEQMFGKAPDRILLYSLHAGRAYE